MSVADARPPSAETYRATMRGRDPEGQPATVIITRNGAGRSGRVRLTLNASLRTTLTMTDEEAGKLIELVTEARDTP
ncbi:MAG: hypothetical protein ACRDT0_10585 [Pseudonocardiaceae bacterium]